MSCYYRTDMKTIERIFSVLMVGIYVLSLAIVPVSAQAVTSTFLLSPRTKNVVIGSTFDVTINITATATKEISYARAILVFNPTMLEMPQALEAGSMFCDYPTDAANYIADNTQGQIMITGISTGQATCPFPVVNTDGTLFARITFKAKKTGKANLAFLFNNQAADGMSGISDTSSPSLFIMSTPRDGAYTILSSASATPTPPGNLGVDPRVLLGVAVAAVAIGWYMYPRKRVASRVVTFTEG